MADANRRLADAAQALRQAAERGDAAARERARREFSEAQDALRAAAGDLRETLSRQGEKTLEQLRDRVPDLPGG